MKKEKGVRRCFWLPIELEAKAEAIRKELGLGYSQFYRFAVIELIKQFAQGKQTTKEGEP